MIIQLFKKCFSSNTSNLPKFYNLSKIYAKIEVNPSRKQKEKLFYEYLKELENSVDIEVALKITTPSTLDENIVKTMDINVKNSYDAIIEIFIHKNLHIFPLNADHSEYSNIIMDHFKRSNDINNPIIKIKLIKMI